MFGLVLIAAVTALVVTVVGAVAVAVVVAVVVIAAADVVSLRWFVGRPGATRFPPGVFRLVAQGVVLRTSFVFRAFDDTSVV